MEYKSVHERYCPVVGHNVVMEVSKSEDKKCISCLNKHNCDKENGGCNYQSFLKQNKLC